uniref:Putative salivary lipocalin n=1 Tax=Ixodes ricinus TaxID=34613 RepID=A0A0K8R874_IXORI
MYLLSIFVIFCLSICSHSQDTTEATPLPEDDPQNFQYQNATKLVELNGTHWVKRRTYNVTTSQRAPTCEYAKIHGKGKENEYTLELGAKWGSGRWTSQNQTLLLETTGNHSAPNVLNFTRLSGDGRQGHPLLYSDYGNCSIVRIKRRDPNEYVCDLLLLNGAAKHEPPSECEERFKKYCKGDAVEVYDSSCEKAEAEAM